jgi:hypothetical protein
MRRKGANNEKVRVTIWMPQELKKALLEKANVSGMPASTIVEKLLQKYLDNVTFEVEVKEIQAVEKGTAGLGETLGGEDSSSKSTRRQA